MNIFAVHTDPIISAQSLVDRHCVKMILESCQLLSTAHRVLDGTKTDSVSPKSGRKVSRWVLPDGRDTLLYNATHVSHPSAVWCRASNNNYNWLYCHFLGLLNEYTYRYGKVHKCDALKYDLASCPHNIPIGPLTPVTPAMADEYKVPGDSVASYRKYYQNGKSHLHKYTKRPPPDWLSIVAA